MWWLAQKLLKFFWWMPWWAKLSAVVVGPLAALNVSVAFFGNSLVSPLSPFFLKEKWQALKAYAKHRPRCFLLGHDDILEQVAAAEKTHHLPTGIFRAIVETESNAQAHRISFAGAMGPAQLMGGTASMMHVDDPFDPRDAIFGGAAYFAQCLQHTHNLTLAVAAYNAGLGNVSDGKIPQNGETEFYVKKVMKRYSAMAVSAP
jgi:soluble lytic murein transglycosylase-like protein